MQQKAGTIWKTPCWWVWGSSDILGFRVTYLISSAGNGQFTSLLSWHPCLLLLSFQLKSSSAVGFQISHAPTKSFFIVLSQLFYHMTVAKLSLSVFPFTCFYVPTWVEKNIKISHKSFNAWLRWKSWCIDKNKVQHSATGTDLTNKSWRRSTWLQCHWSFHWAGCNFPHINMWN